MIFLIQNFSQKSLGDGFSTELFFIIHHQITNWYTKKRSNDPADDFHKIVRTVAATEKQVD